jgi:hypothetical protein
MSMGRVDERMHGWWRMGLGLWAYGRWVELDSDGMLM